MSTCPKCGTQYPNNVRFCTRDGAVLEDDAPAEAAQIGKVVAGKYRLDAYLSRGGMGSVFRATHLMLEKPLALKIIKPELVGSSEFVRRFQREARAATSLNHPNIVSVYDLGQAEDGILYIAMELVDGPSLKDAIQRGGPMDPVRIARLTRQVLSALALAHRNQIVHRDLKPQNIMLATDRDGNELAKLVDFGIAKTFDDRTQLTATGFAIGTPQYMAPEQASGTDVDGRSDLYSLGIILYEMLVAEVPFNAPSTPAILVKHLTEAPVRPSLRRSDVKVHGGLEDVAVRCLEKDPAKRFQSAEEMAQAIAAAVPLGEGTGSITVPLAAAAMAATQTASPAVQAPASRPAAAIAPVPIPLAAAPPPQRAATPGSVNQPASSAAAQPVAAASADSSPVVKGGRNSLALGVGALAIVALAGMGFAVQHFVADDSSESASMLPAAADASASAAQPSASPAAPAAAASQPPPAEGSAQTEAPAAAATSATGASRVPAAGGAQQSAEPNAGAAPATGATNLTAQSGGAASPPSREQVRKLAANAARGTVPPPAVAAAERSTAPPPSPPPAPAAPAAPQLSEHPTVLLRCDGAPEVCGAVRDAFGAALERQNMALTSSAPRADIYIVVNATAVDGQVQQQFGTTFVTRNYVISVELEAPRLESAPSAPQARTFSADLRVGRERVNENARLVAMDTVQKIREFWTRRRSAQ